MKHTRLVIAALVGVALGGWAVMASACDGKEKAAAASASNTTCSAAMAAKCTPEMAAACKAKMSAAAASACPHGAKGTSAAAASGCSYHDAATTFTAGSEGGNGHASCAAKNASTAAAHSCSDKASAAGYDASVAGSGGACQGHGMAKASGATAHGDCDACADMAFCDGEVRSLGAMVQVVPLKNGVMYVYTAAAPNRVQAVQAAMSRRNDHMSSIMSAGDKVHLCPECKRMRGAIASGKLTRELINIEGGCLTLMTSSDPSMVSRIHSMAGVKGPLASKS